MIRRLLAAKYSIAKNKQRNQYVYLTNSTIQMQGANNGLILLLARATATLISNLYKTDSEFSNAFAVFCRCVNTFKDKIRENDK